MKKLVIYSDLRHECSGYWTMAIDVEKIVELNSTEFDRLKRDTLKDIVMFCSSLLDVKCSISLLF